jgi:methylmalonyl-CoA epimerase
MIKGVGHIGIVVGNIEETISAISTAFGIDAPQVRENPEKKVKFAVVNLGGVGLELLQDDSEDGDLAQFHRERGDAIHHFAVLTDDIEGDIDTLQNRGIEMADQSPKIGLRGKKIAFSKPSALKGIPFELSEP